MKYCCALSRSLIEAELVEIDCELEERHEIVLEQMRADRDHIHLLCWAHSNLSPTCIERLFPEYHHLAPVSEISGPEERSPGDEF